MPKKETKKSNPTALISKGLECTIKASTMIKIIFTSVYAADQKLKKTLARAQFSLVDYSKLNDVDLLLRILKQNISLLEEKVFAIVTLKNELRKLKGKNVVEIAVSKPIATVAPGMIASTKEVPNKESTIKPAIAPSPELKVYSRKPKASRSVGSSSKVKIVESKTSNIKEPKQSWGSNVSDVLSSSRIDCRYCHNVLSVGQFCDSDLEVAFRKHICFIRNLDGVDLLKGSRGSNLYILSMDKLLLSSPICLLSKASKTKSWLWHKRLSHLNFDYITSLVKQGLVRGLQKLKYQKDHFCSAYALGKSKKYSHKPKAEDSIQEKLYVMHMDFCGIMRIQSINRRKYILVIVDDYSRTDNGTEFVNQTLKAYYEEVGISHQTSVARTPQHNGVVERRNHTLVEASRTMLIFSKALLLLLAEAFTTACYTQNRSLIRKCHNKTPYELLHDRKPDLSYLYVFGALCYPTNDDEDLVKMVFNRPWTCTFLVAKGLATPELMAN
ncbi:retrovirus-related pol polyprotein from transposon TNT 1-94, partial [Tanacetum coccineum]